MGESAVVNEWTREARQEASLATARDGLETVLRREFGEAVSTEVVAMIAAQTESATLKEWLGEAAAAGSWEQFLRYPRRGV